MRNIFAKFRIATPKFQANPPYIIFTVKTESYSPPNTISLFQRKCYANIIRIAYKIINAQRK